MLKFFGSKSKKKSDQNQQETFEKVAAVIKEITEDEDLEIIPETRLEDLGFDSIRFMNLILSLEDLVEKDIEEIVEEIDITQIATVQDVVDAAIELG